MRVTPRRKVRRRRRENCIFELGLRTRCVGLCIEEHEALAVRGHYRRVRGVFMGFRLAVVGVCS